MNENELMGISRLEEAFRRHDRLYLEKYPPEPLPHKGKRLPKKRLATILIAAAFVFGSILTISAVRSPLGEWVMQTYREFIEIFFEGNTDITPPSAEIPSEIPEGYQLTETYLGEYERKQIWKNEKGELLVWTQLPSNTKTTLDSENSEQQRILIEETEIFRTEKNGRKTYTWHTDTHFFSLTTPSALSEEECLRLIQSSIQNK